VVDYLSICLTDRYRLLTARNGWEGLEKAVEHIPDVVLCDVMMPELDGFETCRRLKEDRRTSHVPIILLTARVTQEDKVKGLTQGADAYLTKPFDKKELLVRLENLAALSQRLKDRLMAAEPPADAVEQREAAFLREVDQAIAANLHREEFNTYHLCRAVAMSRAQLHRKLKALTGWSTAAYIRTVRLRRAKALLESSDLPVGEIALQVGFKSFSHFSRSFAKEFGLSPSETRK
jgi:DNA-binding response OmpR family regulator